MTASISSAQGAALAALLKNRGELDAEALRRLLALTAVASAKPA